MKNRTLFLLFGLIVGQGLKAMGASATWDLNPISNDWHTAANWTPMNVPDRKKDVATFNLSTTTNLMDGGATNQDDAGTDLDAIVFAPGANPYTLTVLPGSFTIYAESISFYGAGIVNNSGIVQNIVVGAVAGPDSGDSAALFFNAASSAGENIVITNQGGGSSEGNPDGGFTIFARDAGDTASAGKATIINEGSTVSGTYYGGTTDLYSYSTAEAATFVNEAGLVSGAAAGHTFLYTGGNIGSSTFINNPATVTGAEGGWTELDIGICAGCSFIANGATSAGPQGGQVYTYGGAGNATFTAKGGQGSGAQGGLIEIHNMPDWSQTIATAEAGGNGGLGGLITIEGTPFTLDQVQFSLLGNGTMQLTEVLSNPVTIGSLSGDGVVSLGGFTLVIGGNNLDTTFSGVIEDDGAIAKAGTGTLTLSGANSYSGSTTVTGGTLIVANRNGSGTGAGPVSVTAGTLGGSGRITGTVTVGTGSGTGASLAPAAGSTKPTTLTTRKSLTFSADATYICTFKGKGKKALSDEVIANGVTINSGAQIDLEGTVQGRLRPGVTFTAISNTSAGAISGTFANLPDGGIVTIGGTNFQASYEGGDGNDLTLTVVR